jgi:hypothetical protein
MVICIAGKNNIAIDKAKNIIPTIENGLMIIHSNSCIVILEVFSLELVLELKSGYYQWFPNKVLI